MQDLDGESQKLIAWTETQLANKEDMLNLLTEIIGEILKFYLSLTPSQLKTTLKSKQIRGAMEHKAPKRNTWDVDKELQAEYIDLFGWYLMKLYIKKFYIDK